MRPVPSGKGAPPLRAVPSSPDAAAGAEAAPEKPKAAPKPKPQPAEAEPKRKKPARPDPNETVTVVEVTPMARSARMQRRHWGVLASFVVIVLLPLAVAAFYLWAVAEDQYGSTVGFTVRREEGGAAADLLGGLTQLSGTGSSDSDILYEFIQSASLVSRVDDELNLRAAYSAPYPSDPYFALRPDATMAELTAYWDSRIVQISYDKASGLIELRVLAFDPQTAQAVAQAILEQSQRLINDLNLQARRDTIAFAERDLETALERLKAAREALTLFRTRTQIVDPSADIQGRMGVINNLQQQLAATLVEYDLLLTTAAPSDPRVQQTRQRIDVIRERIVQERDTFSSADASAAGDDYPSLIAEYEGLSVDREYAEESYRAALQALDVARSNAVRQSRYLTAYVEPTLPQTAEYPRRWSMLGLAALFLTLAWAIMALVYYSIRDSR
ncbi:putative polysaccharide export-assoiated protein [Oceaniovalibus guishaninsula JLT2003]|uniref:Putative polysaccharide export-assoiated protein n=2 Tax=Oceaniovalibus TaxID=1207070 RepID=K2HD86_9RHOB|nr:putative polysaccharide export-assoiated protein [Oceaniovalibus guishaninsula JLT2003]